MHEQGQIAFSSDVGIHLFQGGNQLFIRGAIENQIRTIIKHVFRSVIPKIPVIQAGYDVCIQIIGYKGLSFQKGEKPA